VQAVAARLIRFRAALEPVAFADLLAGRLPRA
jgi:hypothetical protein